MSRSPSFDWKAEYHPRRLAWLALEVLLSSAVLIAIVLYAGDRIIDLWWIYPLVQIPLLLLTYQLGKRLGFVPRPGSQRGAGR